jgi:hypothetical protein
LKKAFGSIPVCPIKPCAIAFTWWQQRCATPSPMPM